MGDAGIQELPIFVPIDYHVIVQAPSAAQKNQRRYKLFLWFCLALGSFILAFDKFVMDGVKSKLIPTVNGTSDSSMNENNYNETEIDFLKYFHENDDNY